MVLYRMVTVAAAILATCVVSCAVDDLDKSRFIGPAGGRVQSADGVVSIDVPAGAVNSYLALSIDVHEKITSAQVLPTYRVNPGLELLSGKTAFVTIRLPALDTTQTDYSLDIKPMRVVGSVMDIPLPAAMDVQAGIASFETTILAGFTLLDYGFTKRCRKQAACQGQEGTDVSSCARSLSASGETWLTQWCMLGETCLRMECCTNPDAPVCQGITPDGDEEEGLEGPEDDEETSADGDEDGDDLQEDEPEEEPEPDQDPEPEPERQWPAPASCTTDNDCDVGQTCLNERCYALTTRNLALYTLSGGRVQQITGEVNTACLDTVYQSSDGPATVKVTVTVTPLGWAMAPDNIAVSVYRQSTWDEGSSVPLATAVTNTDMIATFGALPTNEELFFRTTRQDSSDLNQLVPGNHYHIFIPGQVALNAPGNTGVGIGLYAVNQRTYETYPAMVGYEGLLPADGGTVWTVARDCAGYFLAYAVGLCRDWVPGAVAYLNRDLGLDTAAVRTDARGHMMYFDLPGGTHEFRFVGRVGDDRTPLEVGREHITVRPGEITFHEFNRPGWLIPIENR